MNHTPDELTVDLHSVRKTYRRRIHALRDVDLQVRRGEIFGLLGPNGAGKTTMVKIMMSLVRPDHVQGTLLNQPVGHKPTLGKVGYLPEDHRFAPYLKGREVVEFFGALAHVPRQQRQRRAGELLDLVNMGDWAETKVANYSKGMLQRIGLAQALINDPHLVVLDEPTDGVDPVGRREIRQVLARLRDEGRTVFLNSHLLSEIEMICGRVAIMNHGRIARQGGVEELTARQQYYEIAVQSPLSADQLRDRLAQALSVPWDSPSEGQPAVHRTRVQQLPVELEGHRLRALTRDVERVQPLIDALRRNGHVIQSMQAVRPSLEELFIETMDQANGTPAP